MRKKKMLYLLTVFIILIFSSVSLAAIPVDVTLGKETILNLKEPSKRVSIANPDVAAIVVISPSEIVINGKKPGITSLIVWNNEDKPTFFDIVVYRERRIELEKEKIDALESRIKSFAPDSNIKVEIAGNTIVLTGTVKNRYMLEKIETVALLYGEPGCKGIQTSPSLPGLRSKKADQRVERPRYATDWVGYYAFREPMREAAREALEEEKKGGEGGPCVLDLISIPEAEQVLLEIKVAQIDKTKLKQLGIGAILQGIGGNDAEMIFPGLAFSPTGKLGVLDVTEGNTLGLGPNGETITTGRFLEKSDIFPGVTGFDIGTNPPQIGVAHFPSGVAVVLRALQEKGFGKILAEPNLLVRSGDFGEFHVGQRIPIQTVYGIGTAAVPTITFEQVGIKLNFYPEVLETGAIRLTVDPAEVSSVARFIAVLGGVAPEIDTRTVNTSVDLKEGESLILAGLLSEEMKKNIQKVPILGDIPILGALFRSTNDELKQTELAFFITPRLAKPIPSGVRQPLPTDNQPTPELEKEFEWIPVPDAMR